MNIKEYYNPRFIDRNQTGYTNKMDELQRKNRELYNTYLYKINKLEK